MKCKCGKEARVNQRNCGDCHREYMRGWMSRKRGASTDKVEVKEIIRKSVMAPVRLPVTFGKTSG